MITFFGGFCVLLRQNGAVQAMNYKGKIPYLMIKLSGQSYKVIIQADDRKYNLDTVYQLSLIKSLLQLS